MNYSYNLYGLPNLGTLYDFQDKEKSRQNYIVYMLNRTMQMFRYEGLPETMSKRALELYLQINGHVAIIEHEGNLYSLFGSWGGYPDAYYLPTKYIIANPYLNISKEYTIGEDCVLVRNDDMYRGLYPLFNRYASMLCENDLSMRIADVNARIVSIIEAQDDKTKDSAKAYLKDVEAGKMGIVASTAFLDGLRTQPYSSSTQSTNLSSLIEFQQYLKASWFNEIGLQANYNMKRESINSDEAQLNDDMLLPLVDNMLECRKEAFEEVNSMFGTNITVELNSSWEFNRNEIELEQKMLFSEYSEKPAENEPLEPTEESTEEPTEESTEEPTEESMEEPTEESMEEPTEESMEEPTEESTEEPTEESMEEEPTINIEIDIDVNEGGEKDEAE